ncbi:MAG: phage holin family protein [Chloroflexi bacterium]|nr:phage holin family protein [Chloroflexota bacterium]
MDGEPTYRGLIGRIRERAQAYVRKQIELPKQEIGELIAANLRAVIWFAVALALVWLALVSFVVLVIALLAIVLPLALAALAAFLLFAIVAGLVGYIGYKKLVLHGPDRTIRQVKETVRWLKTRVLGRSASS